MKNLFFLGFFLFFITSSGCCKDDLCEEPISPCEKVPCDDTLNLMGKLDTLWTTKLHPDGKSLGSNRSLIYSNDRLYFTNSDSPVGIISSYDLAQRGKLNWLYSEGTRGFINTYVLPNKGLVVNKTWENRLSIDLMTGEGKEYESSPAQSGPRGIVLGDYMYYDETEDNERTVHLRRSPVTRLSEVETIYTLDNDQIDNSKKSIESMNLWIHPEIGDSILIFQHRMLDRVDVVAWNMDKREVVWRHDDITPNGNSNHQQIFIHKDKAYFGGSVSFFCFDMYDGRIVWRYDDTSGQTPFMVFNPVYAASIDAIVVHGGASMFAFDINSGNIKWSSTFEGSIDSGSPIYHDGIIYRTGRGLLYAYRASNGLLLWSERSSRIPLGRTSFQGELAIDPERGILYATDDDELFAIKVYED